MGTITGKITQAVTTTGVPLATIRARRISRRARVSREKRLVARGKTQTEAVRQIEAERTLSQQIKSEAEKQGIILSESQLKRIIEGKDQITERDISELVQAEIKEREQQRQARAATKREVTPTKVIIPSVQFDPVLAQDVIKSKETPEGIRQTRMDLAPKFKQPEPKPFTLTPTQVKPLRHGTRVDISPGLKPVFQKEVIELPEQVSTITAREGPTDFIDTRVSFQNKLKSDVEKFQKLQQPGKVLLAGVGIVGISAGKEFIRIGTDPLGFAVGTVKFVGQAVTQPIKTTKEIATQFGRAPFETIGQLGAQSIVFKGLGKGIKKGTGLVKEKLDIGKGPKPQILETKGVATELFKIEKPIEIRGVTTGKPFEQSLFEFGAEIKIKQPKAKQPDIIKVTGITKTVKLTDVGAVSQTEFLVSKKDLAGISQSLIVKIPKTEKFFSLTRTRFLNIGTGQLGDLAFGAGLSKIGKTVSKPTFTGTRIIGLQLGKLSKQFTGGAFEFGVFRFKQKAVVDPFDVPKKKLKTKKLIGFPIVSEGTFKNIFEQTTKPVKTKPSETKIIPTSGTIKPFDLSFKDNVLVDVQELGPLSLPQFSFKPPKTKTKQIISTDTFQLQGQKQLSKQLQLLDLKQISGLKQMDLGKELQKGLVDTKDLTKLGTGLITAQVGKQIQQQKLKTGLDFKFQQKTGLDEAFDLKVPGLPSKGFPIIDLRLAADPFKISKKGRRKSQQPKFFITSLVGKEFGKPIPDVPSVVSGVGFRPPVIKKKKKKKRR